MALVTYSDSEGSDTEDAPTIAPPSVKSGARLQDKPAFQKLTKSSEPRKIKVDLPSVKPETTTQDEQQPPAKRARTVGAFSGFNSLLPAPKQPAKSAPKAGVSLKTSSEAVFSRAAPSQQAGDWNGDDDTNGDGINGDSVTAPDETPAPKEEVKLVGKATKFRPLSVANKKKPIKKAKPVEESSNGANDRVLAPKDTGSAAAIEPAAAAPPPKPKRSLFSVSQPETQSETAPAIDDDDLINGSESAELNASSQPQQPVSMVQAAPTNPNSLQSVASDLNLTPAQQRQLFGRKGKGQDVQVANFNLDSEYAANEQLRQAGEVVEHRAVKAIAPGKHSLQQLVNNARTQHEGLEDKWAAGRQARGEGGSKYGWGK